MYFDKLSDRYYLHRFLITPECFFLTVRNILKLIQNVDQMIFPSTLSLITGSEFIHELRGRGYTRNYNRYDWSAKIFISHISLLHWYLSKYHTKNRGNHSLYHSYIIHRNRARNIPISLVRPCMRNSHQVASVASLTFCTIVRSNIHPHSHS